MLMSPVQSVVGLEGSRVALLFGNQLCPVYPGQKVKSPSAKTAKSTYRLGVIGFAHMHVNALIAQFIALERVELIACADTIPTVPSLAEVDGSRRANLRRALENAGPTRVYEGYMEMLDTEDLDIVIFCPEISRHAEVAEALAVRGIHMVTEKPMAGSLSDALRMVRAARDADVALMVNWPTTWDPWVLKVKDLIDAGEIGEVWEFKWRNGPSLGPLAVGSTHPGNTVISGALSDTEKSAEWWHQADAGGGALLDYCSYGACLSSWYLGEDALAVQGFKANLLSPFGSADDNAAMLVRFPRAVAILEGTWTTFHAGVPTGPIVYGTEGTIVVDRAKALVYKEQGDPNPTRAHAGDPLPVAGATIAEVFIRHLETGEPPHPTLDIPLNLASVAILDAGIRSAASGKVEPVDNAQWAIG